MRNNTTVGLFLFYFTVLLAGCGGVTPSTGEERGPCYGNGTCNSGLLCASAICVLPPPAGNDAASGFGDDASYSLGDGGDGDAGMGNEPDAFSSAVPDDAYSVATEADAGPAEPDAFLLPDAAPPLERFFDTGFQGETFTEANDRCRALGMFLPIIGSVSDNEELVTFLRLRARGYTWLGILLSPLGDLVWSATWVEGGTPVEWTAWAPGQPTRPGVIASRDRIRVVIEALGRNWSNVEEAWEFTWTVCERPL